MPLQLLNWFPFLSIPIGITSSSVGLKICATVTGIKMYNVIIRKKKKKQNIIPLLAKSTLNSIEVLISKVVINTNISHDEFVLINNVLKEYGNMKQEIKNVKT